MKQTANHAIAFSAPGAVRDALAAVGRTEDVAVSADGTRLALAAYSAHQIYIFSLAMTRHESGLSVELPGFVCLSSDSFVEPHGCVFLDADTLLVCNRGGDVVVVRVPEPTAGGCNVRVRPEAAVRGRGVRAHVKTPGSAAVYAIGDRQFRAFVCSDQWHFITSHVISLGEHVTIENEGICIENTLQIPDGIAISPDRQWVAVSNHIQGQVQMFRNTPALDRQSPPDAVLAGIVCPHGLSFDAQGNLYVADAASPYVHRYARPEAEWADMSAPTSSIRMLDNRDFYRGRYAAREGGVKGIHLEQNSDVLITTHKLGNLVFLDARSLDAMSEQADPQQMSALRRERDAEIVRTKTAVLGRKWNSYYRARGRIEELHAIAMAKFRAVPPYLNRRRLRRENLRRRDSVLDPAGPVLSMTSHSLRVAWAYLAIESIADGELKPARLILWLPEDEAARPLPDSLRRLQQRGLDIRYTEDVGPHTKYFPYLESESHFARPLVTADDDIVYPRTWLADLIRAAEKNPVIIHCHRARRMRLNDYHFEPYGSWAPAGDTRPDPLNFAIGASGVIYPPEFLSPLKARGRAFLECCPTADDIWLNRVARLEGFLVAQVATGWPSFQEISASQVINLCEANIDGGGNQLQLDATCTPAERASLIEADSLARSRARRP